MIYTNGFFQRSLALILVRILSSIVVFFGHNIFPSLHEQWKRAGIKGEAGRGLWLLSGDMANADQSVERIKRRTRH